MTNYERLIQEMSDKQYFPQKTYEAVLEENGLDPYDDYDKFQRPALLESVYSIWQMLSNDIDLYRKTETEFVTTSAAYSYIQKRLNDIRAEIDRLNDLSNESENLYSKNSAVGYFFFNS